MPTQIGHSISRQISRRGRKRSSLDASFEVLFFAEVEERVDARYAEGDVVDGEPGWVG